MSKLILMILTLSLLPASVLSSPVQKVTADANVPDLDQVLRVVCHATYKDTSQTTSSQVGTYVIANNLHVNVELHSITVLFQGSFPGTGTVKNANLWVCEYTGHKREKVSLNSVAEVKAGQEHTFFIKDSQVISPNTTFVFGIVADVTKIKDPSSPATAVLKCYVTDVSITKSYNVPGFPNYY